MLWLTLGQLLCVWFQSGSALPPNIVTIIADDMGWNDASFHGSNQIPTPNIDALAYNGVIMSRHYTLPTCTPSRAAYLTGKYPIRTGMQGYPLKAGEPRGLSLEETILPERLRDLGYVTRLIGKWHQGSFKSEFTPTFRGFDSFLGYWNGYIGYFDYTIEENGIEGVDFHRDNCSTAEYIGRYATDVFTDEAVDIINKHDTNRPLYLHLAHLAVHSGNDANLLEVPDVEEALKKFSYIPNKQRRLYAEMVTKLDESVGRVVKALSERGILNNTILLFISDNGAQTQGLHENWGSNWPLRGMKFTIFEGGVRGLAAVWSPELKSPGRVTDQLVHLADWLPTLYFAAGGNISDLGPLDGINQWPSFLSREGSVGNPRRQILVNVDEAQDTEALIDEGWKIMRGDYNKGVYDGYFGDDGRGPENPAYNVSRVLNSEVNRALQNVRHENEIPKRFQLDGNLINALRSEATVDCTHVPRENGVPKKAEEGVIACKEYCLFDLVHDPCETRDLSSERPEKVRALRASLDEYREATVPQTNRPVDALSLPCLHGGLWVSWMDDTDSPTKECLIQKKPEIQHTNTGCQLCFTITAVICAFVLGLYLSRN